MYSKKLHTLFIVFLLLSSWCFAQNGINYKAIVKDGSGNVLASSPVSIQFIVYEGVALSNNVYQESHTTNTDPNGLVILNIGEGTTSDVFADISWGNDDHYLNVHVNTGTGLVDLGTTQFKTVPYALQAAKADEAFNVTGLEALDEGNGIGWRLIGKDPESHGDIGLNAIDLTTWGGQSDGLGATGDYSLATGYFSLASGLRSTAIGSGSQADADYSIAMGWGAKAFGNNAIALGQSRANSYASMSVGRFNLGVGDVVNWVETDPLFEIGNGTSSSNRTNALTVLKNGTITAPSFDLAEITDDKALITKEYADNNHPQIPEAASGLEQITENGNTGWRIKGRDPNYYGDIGFDAIDFSYNSFVSVTHGATGDYSTALGNHTTASGDNSTAMGNFTTASGDSSTAMGISTTASGDNSTVIGYNSTASGDFSIAIGMQSTASESNALALGVGTEASGLRSTALGDFTTASGNSSTALGRTTIAEAYSSLAIGRYNEGGGNPTNWLASDPLFEIGNGTTDAARKNALTVLKNGKLYLTPTHDDAALADASGYLIIGEESGANIVFDNNEMMARDNAAASPLYFQRDGGNVSIGNVGSPNVALDILGSIQYTGTITDVSDRRLKENLSSISDPLEKLQHITGYSYNMIDDSENVREYGVIAQDVQKVFPEMVTVVNEEEGYLGVSYTQLIPVLLEAIKEQQAIINKQAHQNNEQQTTISAIQARLEKLEAVNN